MQGGGGARKVRRGTEGYGEVRSWGRADRCWGGTKVQQNYQQAAAWGKMQTTGKRHKHTQRDGAQQAFLWTKWTLWAKWTTGFTRKNKIAHQVIVVYCNAFTWKKATGNEPMGYTNKNYPRAVSWEKTQTIGKRHNYTQRDGAQQAFLWTQWTLWTKWTTGFTRENKIAHQVIVVYCNAFTWKKATGNKPDGVYKKKLPMGSRLRKNANYR